jgi:metal-dependent amidase/aminoacylase/carboxypeptidase family protein
MIDAQTLLRDEDMAYAIDVRRKLHQEPEVGFDLPKTCAFVRGSKMVHLL